jgi:hypothetical protein
MILSRARGYVFLHIPKTGGTALALALEARAAADDILIGDTPKARRRAGRWKGVKAAGRLWKHSRLVDLPGLVPEEELARLLPVTLVRNPWDRMVSYYHWLRDQGFAHPAVGLAKSHDFGGFLAHPHTQASLRLSPYGAWMRRADGTEAPGALFLRLEALAEEAGPFEARLGYRLKVPRANESLRPRDWRLCYGEAEAALVADLCAEDIARFGYRFDPPGL